MLRRLGRKFPQWLQYSLLGAIAFVSPWLGVLSKDSKGGVAWGAVFAGCGVAALAVLIKRLGDWQTTEAARLDVDLRIVAPDEGILRWFDEAGYISAQLQKVKTNYYAPLPPSTKKPGSFSTTKRTKKYELVDLDDPGRDVRQIPLSELRKKAEDGDLTERERDALEKAEATAKLASEWYASTGKQMAELLSTLPANVFGYQEERSVAAYKDGVGAYLEELEKYYYSLALAKFNQTEVSRIFCTLDNDTKETVSDVKVVVTLRGDLFAFDPTSVTKNPRPPEPPRRWGDAPPWGLGLSAAGLAIRTPPTSPSSAPGPQIENRNGICVITYPAMTVMAEDSAELPPVLVLAGREAAENIEVTWVTRATSATGKKPGSAQIKISPRSVAFSELGLLPD